MKKTLTIAAAILCGLLGTAFAAEIDQLTWDKSNIAILRGLDEAAIEKFVNELSEGDVHKTVGEFSWTDLAGDGRYELVTTLDLSGRSFFDYLAVYERDNRGEVSVQWFSEETAIGKLSDVIRDINGDGKDELIISKLIVENPGPLRFYWPTVYRLENGNYVEASRDFASFYDNEILPQLATEISKAQAEIAAGKTEF